MKELEILTNAQKENKISKKSFLQIKRWLEKVEYKEFRKEVLDLVEKEKWSELEDGFSGVLEFGTGGIRGMMGVGPNRINFRTIGEASQGLANYLWRQDHRAKKEKGIVIAYDTRNNSRQFAEYSAKVFCGNGIKTYLFEDFRSTPELSFTVHHLSAQAGVVISASHNPPTDNGFKVYWSDGGQIIPPHDLEIIGEVKKVEKIKTLDLDIARIRDLLIDLGEEVDQAYLDYTMKTSQTNDRSAKIVFTPLCGTGGTSVLRVLKKLGFEVYEVPEQAEPDGSFTSVKNHITNPEFPGVFDRAEKRANKVSADLILASDPDADRIGLEFFDKKSGKWQALSGNQIGVVLLRFLLSELQKKNLLSPRQLVVKTFVTTNLVSKIAESFGLRVISDLLVGFKYIANVIEKEDFQDNFIFGAEESHGFLAKPAVRDKDAAQAAILVAELASQLKNKGETIGDYLDAIYKKYGYYKEILYNMELRGIEGRKKILEIMKDLRENPPRKIGRFEVIRVIDRMAGDIKDRKTGEKLGEVLGFRGDMISFILSEDGETKLTVRPSGTEPKAKFYAAHWRKVDGNLEEVKVKVDGGAKEILDDMVGRLKSFVK
jgi:phosphoglucomutase/phosphomannomutase